MLYSRKKNCIGEITIKKRNVITIRSGNSGTKVDYYFYLLIGIIQLNPQHYTGTINAYRAQAGVIE